MAGLAIVGDCDTTVAPGLESSAFGSQAKATLGLAVRNALAGVEFIEASFDLGKKHETLDRVIHCRLWRHLAERFDDPISSHLFRHNRILRHVANAGHGIAAK